MNDVEPVVSPAHRMAKPSEGENSAEWMISATIAPSFSLMQYLLQTTIW